MRQMAFRVLVLAMSAGCFSAAAQEQQECKAQFAVGKRTITGGYLISTWPRAASKWWLVEGNKKFPGMCEGKMETAKLLLAWEVISSRYWELALPTAGSSTAGGPKAGSTESGNCFPSVKQEETADGRIVTLPNHPDLGACQREISDASRSGIPGRNDLPSSPSRTDRPGPPLRNLPPIQKIKFSIYRLPLTAASKPVASATRESLLDDSFATRRLMEPILKKVQDQFKKIGKAN